MSSNVRQLLENGVPIYPITEKSLVIGLQDAPFESYIVAWDGTAAPTVANVPAGVVINYSGTDYTGTLAASSSTAPYLYLVASTTQQGEYDRYITTRSGSSFVWTALGSTAPVSPVIADDLVTNDSSKALSAKQGKILNDNLGQLDQKTFGFKKNCAISVIGRTNYKDEEILFRAGVKYTVRVKVASTPSGYVNVTIRDASANVLVDFGSITDTYLHETTYTPAADFSACYVSLYVSVGTAAQSADIEIFSQSTMQHQVDELGDRFGFSGTKQIGATGGRYDFTGPFTLEKGVKYILNGKLSKIPATYIAIALRDSGDNELATLGLIYDTGEHSAVFVPTNKMSGAYIYVYANGNDNDDIIVSVQLSSSDSVDGELNDARNEIGVLAANESAKDKLSQLKRQPRISATTQGITPLVLLHFSDIHGSAENLGRIIDFRNAYKTKIDDILNTGDTVEDAFADTYIVPLVEGASAELVAIGNHDSRANGEWTGAGAVACYEKYIAPYVSGWGVTQPENAAANGYNYYYKDYATAKVRLIVLDAMFWDATQLAWLQSVLASALTAGLSVVCAAHYAGGKITPFDIPWCSLQYDDVGNTLPSDAPAAVQSFIQSGGEFVCWLSGHGHFDMAGVLDDYPQQINIAIDTASYGVPSSYSDIQRTRFTKSEDLFNIFSVDTFNKTVRIFRVGADRDAQLRHRGDLVIKYTTATVIYTDC